LTEVQGMTTYSILELPEYPGPFNHRAMKSILTLLLFCIAFIADAQKQKVALEDDTILVNGVPYAILEKSAGMTFNFTVKSLEGKELIYFQFLEFNNPQAAVPGNPKGRVTYFEVTFFHDKQKCEVDATGGKKSVAKLIVANDLIKDNAVNQEGEDKLVMISGMKFSEEKKASQGTTIIINTR